MQRAADTHVRSDIRVVAGLGAIYCKGVHAERGREPLVSDAAALGVYGRRRPLLCAECAEHIRYAEQRRAYCPQDPKPFCSHCETHCYMPDEAEWQRQMMRFAGPRSLLRGYAAPAIRHALEARRFRKGQAPIRLRQRPFVPKTNRSMTEKEN